MTPPAGPDAFSWAAATLRGLHPLRWGLALVGVGATVLVAAGLQAFWEAQVPRPADWFGDPFTQAQALWDHLSDRSVVGLVVRLGVVLVILAAIWAVVGSWIARHELVARQRGEPYGNPEPVEPGPTRLVAGRLKTLVISAIPILAFCAVLLIPVALAGLLNRLGGVGAILVALVLPLVLVADLLLLLIAIGAVAWPLMPITTAAENSDVFDALSRAYNYLYQRPVRFALLTMAALALAALPLAAVLFALAGPVENWPTAAGHPAVWAAAGLSASIFWSVHTLTYLHLRASVDGTDANEIAGEAEPGTAPGPTPAAEDKSPGTDVKPAPPPGLGPVVPVLMFGFMVATWYLTAWLFARVGGANAGWLGWGLGGHLMPPPGYYFGAALLANAWGLLWFAAPFLVVVRRALRREAAPGKESPPEPGGGGGSAEALLK